LASKKLEEIRVGFLIDVSSSWMGGINYLKNLFISIQKHHNEEIKIFLFVPISFDKKIFGKDVENLNYIKVNFLTKWTPSWFLWKIFKKIFKSDFLVQIYLYKYKIQIFSHSNLCKLIKAKSINWIPDLQHLFLTNFFSQNEINSRDRNIKNLLINSNIVLFSSYCALNDCINHFEVKNLNKLKVLQFISNSGPYEVDNIYDSSRILKKYNITGDYFLIPNQFWKHKNHLIVFEAMRLLKEEEGINVKLVCTGLLYDYRDIQYSELIKNKINELQIDVILLGVIDYQDLIILIKKSISVINPSFFEGWSSTVEECKSLGKNLIISNIEVHKEQSPENCTYFDPNDAKQLSKILEFNYKNIDMVQTLYDEFNYNTISENNTRNFALTYRNILFDSYNI
jgi:hypothetical protein